MGRVLVGTSVITEQSKSKIKNLKSKILNPSALFANFLRVTR